MAKQELFCLGGKKYPQFLLLQMLKWTCLISAEGTFFGGSMRIFGSHSPGGRTITSSRNSSTPAIRSSRSLALYATSLKSWQKIAE